MLYPLNVCMTQTTQFFFTKLGALGTAGSHGGKGGKGGEGGEGGYSGSIKINDETV